MCSEKTERLRVQLDEHKVEQHKLHDLVQKLRAELERLQADLDGLRSKGDSNKQCALSADSARVWAVEGLFLTASIVFEDSVVAQLTPVQGPVCADKVAMSLVPSRGFLPAWHHGSAGKHSVRLQPSSQARLTTARGEQRTSRCAAWGTTAPALAGR